MNTVLMMRGDFNENQAFLQFKKGMKLDLIPALIAGVEKIMTKVHLLFICQQDNLIVCGHPVEQKEICMS